MHDNLLHRHFLFIYGIMLAAVAKERGNSLKRLAYHSTATCSAQAAAYGKCIVATYSDVTKNTCKDEFLLFKRCLSNAVCFLFQLVVVCVHQCIDEESPVTGTVEHCLLPS